MSYQKKRSILILLLVVTQLLTNGLLQPPTVQAQGQIIVQPIATASSVTMNPDKVVQTLADSQTVCYNNIWDEQSPGGFGWGIWTGGSRAGNLYGSATTNTDPAALVAQVHLVTWNPGVTFQPISATASWYTAAWNRDPSTTRNYQLETVINGTPSGEGWSSHTGQEPGPNDQWHLLGPFNMDAGITGFVMRAYGGVTAEVDSDVVLLDTIIINICYQEIPPTETPTVTPTNTMIPPTVTATQTPIPPTPRTYFKTFSDK